MRNRNDINPTNQSKNKITPRWDKFENFLEDMKKSPTANHTLDRIDNSKGYAKSNCRWATRNQQAGNTRANVLIEFKGETLTLTQWSVRTGINLHTLHKRFVSEWTIEEALTTPIKK